MLAYPGGNWREKGVGSSHKTIRRSPLAQRADLIKVPATGAVLTPSRSPGARVHALYADLTAIPGDPISIRTLEQARLVMKEGKLYPQR